MTIRHLLATALLVATGFAQDTDTRFTTTPSGFRYKITHAGSGPALRPGNVVLAHYTGTLADGTVFDSSTGRAPFVFTLGKGQVIKGWDEGFALLRLGDRATFIIHPLLAYGEKPRGKIPANSTLRFDVEVVDVKERSLADLFRTAIEQGGVPAVQPVLEEYQTGRVDAYAGESLINSLGYRYLRLKEFSCALAIFQANVRLFPNSANAQDSLGECFLKLEQNDAALAAYRRALERDPHFDHARAMIAKITGVVPP